MTHTIEEWARAVAAAPADLALKYAFTDWLAEAGHLNYDVGDSVYVLMFGRAEFGNRRWGAVQVEVVSVGRRRRVCYLLDQRTKFALRWTVLVTEAAVASVALEFEGVLTHWHNCADRLNEGYP